MYGRWGCPDQVSKKPGLPQARKLVLTGQRELRGAVRLAIF